MSNDINIIMQTSSNTRC